MGGAILGLVYTAGTAATATAPAVAGGLTTLGSGLAATAVGAGLSTALAPSNSRVNVPPPPGAAMIDPAGSAAAAGVRRRQASAGGLNSTIGAGATPQASGGPTSGSKTLSGA